MADGIEFFISVTLIKNIYFAVKNNGGGRTEAVGFDFLFRFNHPNFFPDDEVIARGDTNSPPEHTF